MKHRSLALAVGWLALAAPALSADPPAPSARPPHARERLQEELRRRAAALASALPSATPLPSGALSAPSGSAVPTLHGVKLEELARKWRERAASRDERRARHRAELIHEVGTSLAQPEVKAELELHARRLAELSRIEFLAQNARSGEARVALLARVGKLIEKENRRHRRALDRLKAKPAPSASVPVASASAPPPAPSASGTPR